MITLSAATTALILLDLQKGAFREARELIRHEFGLGTDRLADIEVDRVMGDMKRKILKNIRRGAPLPKGQKLRARVYTGNAEGSGRPLIGD